ncbi:nuclear transport factor 2 family protein [Acidisphaera sp. S103]|uniref:nuclear transport factor 2 family protein n=1 Tax=Acidisphaera sp. S103 TaxID=1747223 RepID=UPI00131C495F|nr:nuclear transport factor 2 family protein [Acidisphaera sp. S103]
MSNNSEPEIRHIYETWHKAIRDRDLTTLVALYASNGRFESPAVYALNGDANGIVEGRQAIQAYFETFFAKLDEDVEEWFRTDQFFSNGKLLLWEYPRQTPNGDQTDIVESMDVEDGLIVHHRVYWGWVGFRAIFKALGVAP